MPRGQKNYTPLNKGDKRYAVIKYEDNAGRMKYLSVTAQQAITSQDITILGLHEYEIDSERIAKQLQKIWNERNPQEDSNGNNRE